MVISKKLAFSVVVFSSTALTLNSCSPIGNEDALRFSRIPQACELLSDDLRRQLTGGDTPGEAENIDLFVKKSGCDFAGADGNYSISINVLWFPKKVDSKDEPFGDFCWRVSAKEGECSSLFGVGDEGYLFYVEKDRDRYWHQSGTILLQYGNVDVRIELIRNNPDGLDPNFKENARRVAFSVAEKLEAEAR